MGMDCQKFSQSALLGAPGKLGDNLSQAAYKMDSITMITAYYSCSGMLD